MFRFQRRGVTMTETLIVGALGAAMLGLLLPALSSAIANSQGSTCRNNLARLAQALGAYHDARGHFPASMERTSTPFFAAVSDNRSINWVVRILPYIGEQPIYDSFTIANGRLSTYDANYVWPDGAIGRPINGSSLRADDPPRGTALDIAGMQCPADSGFDVKYRYQLSGSNFAPPQPNNYQLWARGNYGANACLSWPFFYTVDSTPVAPACGDATQPFWTGPTAWRTRGVMGGNVGLSRSQITDGTSHTILLGELRVGLNYADIRGSWAYGSVGASSAWHHTDGPNPCAVGDYLAAYIGRGVLQLLNSNSTVAQQLAAQQCMGVSGLNDASVAVSAAEFRSQHPGGVFVAMADASVRFVSNSVENGALTGYWEWDTDANVLPQFLTWERLNASGDGLVVDDSTDGNFSSTVVPYILGDMNGDGVLDNFDIAAMELALADPAAYLAMYPALTDYQQRGDIDQSGSFDNFDVGAFEAFLAASR